MKIAIVTDIHEDIESLSKAIKLIEKKNCDKIVCLGDITGFNVPNCMSYFNTRNANKCIKVIQENCKTIVLGNHDLYSIKKTPIHDCSFKYPSTWYNLDYKDREKLAQGKLWLYEQNELSSLLNKNSKDFLNSLPEYAIDELEDAVLMFSHYAFPNITGSIIESYDTDNKWLSHFKFIEENNCLYSFTGHSHYQGIAVNVGKKNNLCGFEEESLKSKITWISCPAISNQGKKNGFTIYNSKKNTVEAILL